MKKRSGSFAVYIVSAPVDDGGGMQTVTVTVRAQGPARVTRSRSNLVPDSVDVELYTPSPNLSLTFPYNCSLISPGLYQSAEIVWNSAHTHVAAQADFTVGEELLEIETRAPIGSLPPEVRPRGRKRKSRIRRRGKRS